MCELNATDSTELAGMKSDAGCTPRKSRSRELANNADAEHRVLEILLAKQRKVSTTDAVCGKPAKRHRKSSLKSNCANVLAKIKFAHSVHLETNRDVVDSVPESDTGKIQENISSPNMLKSTAVDIEKPALAPCIKVCLVVL